MVEVMTETLDQSSFIGVWRRESLRIEKGKAFEDSNVLWLHAGDYYADIRWPKPSESQVKASVFAGRAFWNAPRMQFNHEVDLTKELDQDVGILSFSNEKLIELGQVTRGDKVIHFEETWVQIGRANQDDCQVVQKDHETGSGYIIRVKDFVIALEESEQQFSAGAWEKEKNQWNLLFGLGDIQRLNELCVKHRANTLPPEWQVII